MAQALTGRSKRILERFPYHMEAASRGKLLANVTQALVRDQDVQAADMQAIRLAHRLFEARELIDLLRIAALHNINRTELAILFQRFTLARSQIAALRANINSDADLGERQTLANELLALWSVAGESPLRLFSDAPDNNDPDSDDPFDVAIAAARFLQSADKDTRSSVLLDGLRQRIAQICHIHRVGNGTVKALLLGAANCLDLDLDPSTIEHSEDRFWHAAPVTDRVPLQRPVSGSDKSELLEPELEFLGIEENPKRLAEFGPRDVRHASRFHLLRKGFEDALLEIRIRGVGQRTMSPMLVNRDSGHGVGIFAAIPDGVEVVFTQGGRVVMDGKDVTSRCYAWQGACFADQESKLLVGNTPNGSNSSVSKDFVFADGETASGDSEAASGESETVTSDGKRISRFVEVTPAATLDREAKLPHAGDSLPMPSVSVGKTRFAFFVQHAHFTALRNNMPPLPDGIFGSDPFATTAALVRANRELVTPRYGAAIADASVFADARGYKFNDFAAQVHLRWLERQAYKVRLFVPRRFARFDKDDEDGDLIKQYIKLGIDRFRPAGVDVEVQFVDDKWTLGDADLPHEDASLDSAISRIRSQTILNATPELDQ